MPKEPEIIGGEIQFKIVAVCKEDLLYLYERGTDKRAKVLDTLRDMSDKDMQWLAQKMADKHLNSMFWKTIKEEFEESFLK